MNISRPNLAPVAKAVAAFVFPFVVALAAWIAEETGIEVGVDVGTVEIAILAILNAAAVYIIPNAQKAVEAVAEGADEA